MKCKTCEGKGFTEFEHGLVMVECPDCKSTGEIDASDSGTEPADKPVRSRNPSKPKQPSKRKVKKQA